MSIAETLLNKLWEEHMFEDFAQALLKRDELAGVHLLIVAISRGRDHQDEITRICLYNKFEDLRALVVLNAFTSTPSAVFKLAKYCEENAVSQ